MATGPKISAGQLRERVRIERRRMTDDGYGNERGQWQQIASGIPARISPARGGEDVRAGRLAGISNFDIYVRFSLETDAIQTADRLVNERTGAIYNIKWRGNLDERSRFLTLACQSGDTDG